MLWFVDVIDQYDGVGGRVGGEDEDEGEGKDEG